MRVWLVAVLILCSTASGCLYSAHWQNNVSLKSIFSPFMRELDQQTRTRFRELGVTLASGRDHSMKQ